MASSSVSPLLAEHESLGAQFTDFAGSRMPLRYASELVEHRSVRTSAGLFDLSHMGEIVVDGDDAAKVLDYALAGELSKIASGRAKYSLLCDEAGGVIDDLVVYRLADDQFLVVANAANRSTVYDELCARAEGFTANIRDTSSTTALLAVQGPLAEKIVTTLVPDDEIPLVKSMKYYSASPAVVADAEVLLARTGYTGEDGFEMYVANADAVPLWRTLLDVTTSHAGALAGLACRDTLRLEAGMPLYGQELTRDTNPYQAGLGRVVNLGKDFVGRDALQRLSERTTDSSLVGLVGGGRRAARAGYTVHDDHGTPVGTVTSGALSPTLGHPIALAYVDNVSRAPGTELRVDIRGSQEPFTVTPTPFYRRP